MTVEAETVIASVETLHFASKCGLVEHFNHFWKTSCFIYTDLSQKVLIEQPSNVPQNIFHETPKQVNFL